MLCCLNLNSTISLTYCNEYDETFSFIHLLISLVGRTFLPGSLDGFCVQINLKLGLILILFPSNGLIIESG
jgi:hypothetical protein